MFTFAACDNAPPERTPSPVGNGGPDSFIKLHGLGGSPVLSTKKGLPTTDVMYSGGEIIINVDNLSKAATNSPLRTNHNAWLSFFQAKGKTTEDARPEYGLLFGPYPSSGGPAELAKTSDGAVTTRPYWMDLKTDGYIMVAGRLPIISARRVRAVSDGTTFAIESSAAFDRVYLIFDPNGKGVKVTRMNVTPSTAHDLKTVGYYIEIPHDSGMAVATEKKAEDTTDTKLFLEFTREMFKAAPFDWP